MNAVDTNVLIYACDGRDPVKQERALKLIETTPDMLLLWQVACEFIAASRKLATTGFTPAQAWDRLDEFAALMPLVLPSPDVLGHARRLHAGKQVSCWDSMLLGACIGAGVQTLHTEDLPGGGIEGVRVVNPFA